MCIRDRLKKELTGKTIHGISRRGKYLIFEIGEKDRLISHLRMEGKYRLASLNVPMEMCIRDRFKGRNLLDLKEEEWQKIRGNEISMIFQDPMTSLDPTMRIGKQIAEPLLKHNKGMSKADAMKRALELMQQVGIPDAEVHINDYPHQWSGEMCIRDRL